MNMIFTVLMFAAMLAVVAVMGMGLYAMSRGGDFNRKYGNRLMRLRVLLQGLAILFFVLAMATRKGG